MRLPVTTILLRIVHGGEKRVGTNEGLNVKTVQILFG